MILSVDSTHKKHDCYNKNKNNINLKYLICEKLDCVYLNKELKNEIIRRQNCNYNWWK